MRNPGRRIRPLAPWMASVVLGVAFLLATGFITRRPEPREAAPRSPTFPSPAVTEEGEHDLPDALDPIALVPVEGTAEELTEKWLEDDPSAAPSEGGTPDTLDCLIEPYQVVDIGSPVTGLIETIQVDRSDRVTEGQILVELESSVEEAAVELARARAHMTGQVRAQEARLDLGQRRQDRARKLFENKALSLDSREELETEAEIARLELQQAQEEQRLASLQLRQALEILQRRTVRSPISGVVVERRMSPGERVEEDVILRVAQLDPLRIEVILPSALFGTVRPGMRAAITPEIPGDEVHIAEVTVVDSVIDSASGTFGVRLELPNPDHAVPGGLHCQARFLDE